MKNRNGIYHCGFSYSTILLCFHEPAQNSEQDTPIFIISYVNGAIQASNCLEREGRAVLAGHFNGYFLAGLETLLDALDIVDLFASQTKRFFVLPLFELERQNAHANEVAAMNALKALSNGCTNSEQ